MQRIAFWPTIAVFVLGAGCARQENATIPPADHGASATEGPAKGVPSVGAPLGDAPPGPGAQASGSLTPTIELDTKIALLEQQGDAKKELAVAYAERGTIHMNDGAAPPRLKYRAALKDFRQALQLDPANTTAKQGKQLIEQIYQSLGRPVPGG